MEVNFLESHAHPKPDGVLSVVVLFLLGVFLLTLRNSDSLINPILYTEDGAWLGLAFTKGWAYAFLNAKEGYFVAGNIILLWTAYTISNFICDNPLICLPQSISIVSISFYSTIATMAFATLSGAVRREFRWMIFFLFLLIPYGDSSNEIIGRISNIGYMLVPLALFLLYRNEERKSNIEYISIAALLTISAATNPVVIPVVGLYSLWKIIRDGKSFARDNAITLIGITSITILVLFKMTSTRNSSIIGSIDYSNLIEVFIARGILYPFVFPAYNSLTDTLALILFAGWLLLIFTAILHSNEQPRKYLLMALGTLFLYLAFTIIMRQSLTQQLGDYRHTFPDRYFMGPNSLAILLTLGSLSSFTNDTSIARKRIARTPLLAIIALYLYNAPYIFEHNSPRMRIIDTTTFQDEICRSSAYSNGIKKSIVLVPIYFSGWEIRIPPDMLIDAQAKMSCSL